MIEHKKVLLVENASDTRTLKALCEKQGKEWPRNLVEWVTNKKHKERKTLIIELNQKIAQETGSHITAYSLRDLDDNNYNTTNARLHDNGQNVQMDDSGSNKIMMYRTLRRREIENYLIIPEAISRYITGNCRNPDIPKDVDSVRNYLTNEHGLVVPDTYRLSDRASNTEALFIKDVKPVLDGINSYFRVKFDKEEYINSINADEICDDIITVIDEIIEMCTMD
ncbi:hypothetical protein [Aeromonas caviae]|uniref:Uncharacterized protein n=1 Tax=Aeromonas caviae TaxID=648 RepID=A0AAF0GHL1_AERCA|nr:hypothetical protein [Aeromonas caviae]WGC86179.1 hypothetical protein OJY61_23145 [Aeromonas caviae]BBG89073.1 hypothetical protein ACGSH8M1_017390 [Aeromonas caviae]BBT52743.1 hypothetical protein WP8S18C01_17060 [Aeromonas caviae]